MTCVQMSRNYVRVAELVGMAELNEDNEALDPGEIRPFGAEAVVAKAEGGADLLEELGFAHGRPRRCTMVESNPAPA